MKGVQPYIYPAQPHVRKHGPHGYSDYPPYKDWLRDEFDFRCVYCLKRETWDRRYANWVVEHLIPRKERPDLATDYSNLILACNSCNSLKGASNAPDPCQVAYGSIVSVREDGSILAINGNKEGQKLIQIARLDDEDCTTWRRKMINLIKALKNGDPKAYASWMGFPDDLPDLTRLRVKNTKPEGAKNCHFQRRKAGKHPALLH